ncbi:GIN domain-containing protein [Massilia sp. TSP1-1-2]|uniref:GIN domain-containing protein n=1 Tax=unclassified Massilia TaxID=2609279 RepID=UPI003CFBBCBB
MGQLMKWSVATLLGASFGVAGAEAATELASEVATETRSLDARVVRVKLDGQIDLRLKQGAAPSLVISGDKKLLAGTTSEQQGDTLTITNEVKGFKLGRRGQGLRAELTLPQLREVSTDSVGSADVSGFSGDELELNLEGAGSMKVNCSYRLVTATLGGVGSMQVDGGNYEGIDLNLRGAGFVTLKGSSKWLKASLGGLGSMDAQHLQVDTVNLDLSGLGSASVWARQNANLNLSGLGSVTVYGKPVNRSVSVDGLGKVSWK